MNHIAFFFFFSSRRRHTRSLRDWSSDVCSSDLAHHRNRSNNAGGAMSRVADLRVKIFADGADYEGIIKMSKNPLIKGFTTNPTLMRKAGVSDYEAFARKVLAAIPDRPVSFEVFADDFASMAEQARTIAAWGPNV